MLIVALTGGIACGKSVIGSILREKGCIVHSADLIAHELMVPEAPAWKGIVERFGREILNPDRTIDRAKLGKIIFNDAGKRADLNAIVHPLVRDRIEKIISDLQREGRVSIYVTEAALIVEAKAMNLYDKIVVAVCDEDTRIRRLMARDSINRPEALTKIHSQVSSEEGLRHADYKIDTSGTIAETIEQTERLHALLVRDAELKAAEGASSPFGFEPVEIPVDGVLDLHTFHPSDIKDLIPGFLQECASKGILRVRIIHGKGSGALMKTVHAVLSRTPGVESFVIGGSGATIVKLHQDKDRIV